jgi:small neutral amino acid transporter SnatA (MarC family)
MAEVEDDYDDESCSSSEDSRHQRLDISLEHEASDDATISIVPLDTTITVTPRLEASTMIRPRKHQVKHLMQLKPTLRFPRTTN